MVVATKNRQVNMAIRILRLLRANAKGCTELIKQTGGDPTFAYQVLHILRQEKLVVSLTNPKHKQKLTEVLTSTGNDLADLLLGIEKFYDYHTAFRRVRLAKIPRLLDEHPCIDHTKVRLKKLSSWKHVQDYNASIMNASRLEILSLQYFNDLIFYKCSQLMVKKKLSLINSILRHVVTLVSENYLTEIRTLMEDRSLIMWGQKDHLEAIERLPLTCGLSLENPNIANESDKLLSSIFLILRPSKENIQRHIDSYRNFVTKELPPQVSIKENKQGIAFYQRFLSDKLNLS